jgi:hypothetical protein
MKKRNLVFVFIVSIITVGLYDIYWLFSTRDELVKKRQHLSSPWVFFVPLLGLIGIALIQILVHALSVGGPSNATATTTVNILSALAGVACVVAIPFSIRWIWRYCKAVENITKGDLTAGFSFALAVLLTALGAGVLWPPIVQYQLNKISG